MTSTYPPAAKKIARFSLTTADARKLSGFYEQAFGCHVSATERVDGTEFERLMDVQGGAKKTSLALGDQTIELLEFDNPGKPYPKASVASDLIFQHFAIVVSDMAQVYANLCAIPYWTPISRGGPQKLPQTSGGVTAFKFRDPEGHPLELLAFPATDTPTIWQTPRSALCRGIDHSAISVSDIKISRQFYESLGFRVTLRTTNMGEAQQRLDRIPEVQADIMALALDVSTPHLELLCYHSGTPRSPAWLRPNDVAATRIFLTSGNAASGFLFDPDGHRLLIV